MASAIKVYTRPMGRPEDWTTHDYLNEIMHRYGLKTDYALHKKLEVSRQTIYRYRDGLGTFDDSVALKVAELLDFDPAQLLVYTTRERCKTHSAKEHWNKLLHQLAAGSAAALLLGLGVQAFDLVPLQAGQFNATQSIHYTK